MSTTFTALVDSLEALTVTGVTKRYTAGPPAQLNSADLPAQWCDLPRGEERPAYAGAGGLDRTLTVDLRIAVEAVGQNLRINNWPAVVALMDSIATALRTWDQTTAPLTGPCTWRSRLAVANIGGSDYWAVVTEISGLG